MRKLFITALFLLGPFSYALNLAPQMHSLRCQGELSLQSNSSFWMNGRNYLNIAIDRHEEFYLEEAYFDQNGDFVVSMLDKRGWNLISLKIEKENIDKEEITSSYGLIESEEVILTENGVEMDRVNCRAVWKRWE